VGTSAGFANGSKTLIYMGQKMNYPVCAGCDCVDGCSKVKDKACMTTDNTKPVAWIAFDEISGEYFLECEPDSAIQWKPLYYVPEIKWTPLYYATPQPATYPLPDDLYDSKDWREGTYSERVEWLRDMYEAKKAELEVFHSMHENCTVTPQPVIAPERNFCARCGKRNGAAPHIHTCTLPQNDRLSWEESVVELVRKTHIAKGRHNMQIAMCELYELFGLPCVRPARAQEGL
jgi:hypothetical protein